MNPYEAKVAARAERMRARAAARRGEAESLGRQNQKIAEVMNGSPILVGHHSEKRHRRDIDRMGKRTQRAVEATREAEALERRAEAAETNGTISSDDPEALEKLRAKLGTIENARSLATTINAAIRKARRSGDGWEAVARGALSGLPGVTPTTIESVLIPDDFGNYGVPAYRLRSLAAEAKRLKARIADLEAKAAEAPQEDERIGSVTISEGDNRVRLFFDARPDEAVVLALKGRGFRWSPTVGAWQRQTTNAARWAARAIARLTERSGA